MAEWWSSQEAGLIGGIAGGGVGVVMGVLGALMGVFLPRGRGGRGWRGALLVAMVLGIAGVGAGVVAWVMGQPHHVYFVLLLLGGVVASVSFPLLVVVARTWRRVEQRRMQADALRRD